MTITRFSFPTTIHFGAGARRLVGAHLHEQGLRRPLIVTDRGLAALPVVAELRADLEGAGLAVAVYGGIWGNPTARRRWAAPTRTVRTAPIASSASAAGPRSTSRRWSV